MDCKLAIGRLAIFCGEPREGFGEAMSAWSQHECFGESESEKWGHTSYVASRGDNRGMSPEERP